MFLLLALLFAAAAVVHGWWSQSKLEARIELVLVYLLAGYHGIIMLVVALFALFAGDHAAAMLGTPAGNLFPAVLRCRLLGNGHRINALHLVEREVLGRTAGVLECLLFWCDRGAHGRFQRCRATHASYGPFDHPGPCGGSKPHARLGRVALGPSPKIDVCARVTPLSGESKRAPERGVNLHPLTSQRFLTTLLPQFARL